MSPWRLMLAEIGHRWFQFVLGLFAVATAAAMLVAGPMLLDAYQEETNRRIADQERTAADELASLCERRRAERQAERDRLQRDLARTVATQQAKLAALEQETADILADMDKRTSRIMRDIGFNLRIVHKDTNPSEMYTSLKMAEMPEDYVYKLAETDKVQNIVHLVANLMELITWNDQLIMLTGTLPEVQQSHIEKKSPMGFNIKPGTAYVGHAVAKRQNLSEGDEIDIRGHKFTVARILEEHGTSQDVQVNLHLHDAQKVLGKEGKIHQIMALGCHCKEADLPTFRQQLAEVLPDTVITEHLTNRLARAEQRDLVANKRQEIEQRQQHENAAIIAEKKRENASILTALAARHEHELKDHDKRQALALANLKQSRERALGVLSAMVGIVTPLVAVLAAVFIGVMFWNNVRDRRAEIGVLRTIGKTGADIASMFLGKAVFTGLIGGLIGAVAGFGLAYAVVAAMQAAPQWQVSFELLRLDPVWAAVAILGTPALAALAALWPTMAAARQDPAVALQE